MHGILASNVQLEHLGGLWWILPVVIILGGARLVLTRFRGRQ